MLGGVNSVYSFLLAGGIAASVMTLSPFPFLIGTALGFALAFVHDAVREVARASAARRGGLSEANSPVADQEQLQGHKERPSLASSGSQPIWGD